VPDPRALLIHLVSLLKPNGILIGSVPITPSVDANPHHLTDFSAASFRDLGKTLRLLEVDALVQEQSYNPVSVLTGKEKRSTDIRRNLGAYYVANPGRFWARMYSTLCYGFNNRYLTVVRKKPADHATY